ncbi:MAG: hypothetical protein GX589_05785 [Deltaproteobacteria bacterium]|nr:hypothetical protein [Deltaproteobacteria bacterium]
MKIRPDSESDSVRAYYDRLHERKRADLNIQALKTGAWNILRSAERHFYRFDLAARRYHRALETKDKLGLAFERDIMLALLYEAADTVYIVLQLFDPDRLNLTSSADGAGIAGEDASYVREMMDTMEAICKKILHLSKTYNLPLTFKDPVDERERLTYNAHAHWRDLEPGSIEKSFFSYFAQAKNCLTVKLNQVPKFWSNRTLKQALLKNERAALREVVQHLLTASFPRSALSNKVEKEVTSTTRRHLDINKGVPTWQREEPASSGR